MKSEFIYLLGGAFLLSGIGFVSVTIIWLLRLRDTVANALSEAASQQIKTAQRLNESIAQLQKQQDNYNRQINILAQAGMRLQQELSSVTNRLENNQTEQMRGSQTLH